MKDLDFDELDRAVNSLLPHNGGSADEQSATPPIDDTSVPAVDVPTLPAPQPLAARRSSGRFMDVVHPSSDMRASTVPPRPVSREGAVIVPSAQRASLDVPLAPDQNSSSIPVSTPSETTEESKNVVGDWPDPIDFTDSLPGEASNTPGQPSVDESVQSLDDDKDINQLADAISETLGQSQESQAPLESPFLTDAVVEKRPLGAFSSEATLPTGDGEQASTTVSSVEPEALTPEGDPSAKHVDQPTEMGTPLPAELQDDLLLIEAGVETAVEPKKDEPITSQRPQAEAPAGPTSITQQYTEQPSTGDQPTGAIFDTEAYQKPLAHPVKKKSGWLMVLWVVLLLVGGAGAGAAVYFFVLPK